MPFGQYWEPYDLARSLGGGRVTLWVSGQLWSSDGLGGRFITVHSGEDMRHCYVTPAPPPWWKHGWDIVGHPLASGSELRLWIPDGCQDLLIDGTKRVAISPGAEDVWVR